MRACPLQSVPNGSSRLNASARQPARKRAGQEMVDESRSPCRPAKCLLSVLLLAIFADWASGWHSSPDVGATQLGSARLLSLRGGMPTFPPLTLNGGLNPKGFGGDTTSTRKPKSRAVSPPIDDIFGSDDEDSGILQQKLKDVYGECARPGTPPSSSVASKMADSAEQGAATRRYVFLVSDKTGFTASHILTAVLYQFGVVGDSVVTQVFSNVRSMVKVSRIVALAQRIEAFVCFTFVDPALRRALSEHCKTLSVHSMDVLGDLVDGLSSYLDSVPVLYAATHGEVVTPRKPVLPAGYFKRIEAVDFAIKQDDGANPKNYEKADMIILGVSRVQKTPMSTYLAQQFGLKVANVKLHLGKPLDPELSQVDPRRIFALTCQPDYLYKIRRRRARMSGTKKEDLPPGYADLEHIRKENAWCQELFAQHPEWTVVDMTGWSVEEASEVYIRPNLPRKPTPMEGALEALSQFFCIVKVDINEIEQYDAGDWSRRSGSRPRQANTPVDFDRVLRNAAGTTESWWQNMQVMFMSDGLCGLAGITKASSQSYTVVDIFRSLTGPRTEEAPLQELLSALYLGIEKTVDVTCHKPDNNFFTNEVHVSPIKNSAGQDVLVLVNMHPMASSDVNAAPDDSLCHRLNGETFYTILDATSEGLPLWYASKGFFKMTGYTEQEVLARHGQGASFALWGEGTPLGELEDADLQEVKTNVAEGLAVNTCFKSYRKDRKFFWNMAHLEPVYDYGLLRWYVGTHHAVLG